jgi:hypothetical protein
MFENKHADDASWAGNAEGVWQEWETQLFPSGKNIFLDPEPEKASARSIVTPNYPDLSFFWP